MKIQTHVVVKLKKIYIYNRKNLVFITWFKFNSSAKYFKKYELYQEFNYYTKAIMNHWVNLKYRIL